MASSSAGEVTVFTDTDMDTHIAIGVSPDITVADFKRELETMHFSFFPNLGEIKVDALTVKRKSCFYRLSESLPLKYAFQGFKGNWFLQVALRPPNSFDNQQLSKCLASNNDSILDGSHVTVSPISNTRKNDMIHSSNNKQIEGFFDIDAKSAEEGSDLLTPKNEVKIATLEELPETVPCVKKRRKKKKKLAETEKELNRSRESPKIATEVCSDVWTADTELASRRKAPKFAAEDCSDLLNPRNEAQPATIAEALPKTGPCFKERSKGKKRPIGTDKEFGRLKKAPRSSPNECSGLRTPRNPVNPAIFSSPTAMTSKERLHEAISAKVNDGSNMQVHASQQYDIRTPSGTLASPSQTDLRPRSSGNKLERSSSVGKSVVTAAYKLGISANKQRPALSFYRFRVPSMASSAIKISIFDICDNDD